MRKGIYLYPYKGGKIICVTESDITFGEGEMIIGKSLVNPIVYSYDAEERITKVTDSIDGVTEYTMMSLGSC